MTILVLVSLDAMLAATGGLGSTPMRKSNGIRPCMGANWGHAAGARGPPDRTPIIASADCADHERHDHCSSCPHRVDSCVLNLSQMKVSRAPKPQSALHSGAEFDAVGARRRILREARKEVARRRSVDERVRQVSAPQTNRVRPIV